MATTYTSDKLRELFQSSFNLSEWYYFLQNIFNATALRTTPERINNSIDEGFYLGKSENEDGYCIGFFHYNIRSGSVANKRVGLRNLVKTFINPTWGEFDAALVVFDSGDHWRLSFISDIKGEATSPKRYTYVFGSNELLYKTPIDRFNIIQKNGATFENLKKAFSVEALSDEFFNKYREQYANFIAYITGKRFVKVGGKWEEKKDGEPNMPLMQAFNSDEKKIRDYIKKMMGRITFLHFLQRKRWMCDDLNYMQNLFNRSAYQDDYLDSVLEPLFFGILNTKPAEREAIFEEYKWNKSLLSEWKDIPYLNGGLFERDADDEPESVFPASYFKDLFQFFSEYNFTIDENDPNDAEVGVDPEMLGKIFENLLEDNKDKGAFYTPKEIVRYMCQESLIAYLETNTSIAVEKIRKFVLLPEEGVVDIPENKKSKLLEALKEVKICDPAIGSGAFPMGLLNELLRCRETLEHLDMPRSEIKKSIIQNNIYGVDIEKGAVDIARLRFWLSIVVDEDTPSPLPNLDYKIMQGNSLIESFKGIDLSKLTYKKVGYKDNGQFELFDDEKKILQKSLSYYLSQYYSCSDHAEKNRLRERIFNSIYQQLLQQGYSENILNEFSKINFAENNKFFLWHTWFGDVFSRPSKEGFDIVIGNPPYVQLQNNGGELAKLYENCNFQTFAKTGDLYCLFYERGWQLLRPKGHLCFITSNKWMRAGYGEKTRGFFARHTNPKCLIDFAGVKIFENATVDTNILLFSKDKNENKTLCAVTDKLNKESVKQLSDFVQQQHTVCTFNNEESWVILSPIEQSIKQKIESVGTPLKDWDIKIYRGVLTGYNDAFIISTDKREEILANCQTDDERLRTAELIRPILRGRDIKRYGYDWADLWLINTHNGIRGVKPRIDINDYPAVKAHLDQHWDKISKRADKGDTPYNLRNCAYLDLFFQPKICWKAIGRNLAFSIVESGTFLTAPASFISAGSYNEYILAFLCSNVGTYFIYKNSDTTGAGDIMLNIQSLIKFPIPKNKTVNFNERIDVVNHDIYQAYGLTPSEISYIENFI